MEIAHKQRTSRRILNNSDEKRWYAGRSRAPAADTLSNTSTHFPREWQAGEIPAPGHKPAGGSAALGEPYIHDCGSSFAVAPRQHQSAAGLALANFGGHAAGNSAPRVEGCRIETERS